MQVMQLETNVDYRDMSRDYHEPFWPSTTTMWHVSRSSVLDEIRRDGLLVMPSVSFDHIKRPDGVYLHDDEQRARAWAERNVDMYGWADADGTVECDAILWRVQVRGLQLQRDPLVIDAAWTDQSIGVHRIRIVDVLDLSGRPSWTSGHARVQ